MDGNQVFKGYNMMNNEEWYVSVEQARKKKEEEKSPFCGG
jgi:hypothetical protein